MGLDAIVSSAPAFAVVSPLRHDEEQEKWFNHNFEVEDFPCIVGPSHHHHAGDTAAATPGAAATVACQAVVGTTGSSGINTSSSSVPVPSKRRRLAAVDSDGGKSIASVSVGVSSSSERRTSKVGQRSAVAASTLCSYCTQQPRQRAAPTNPSVR